MRRLTTGLVCAAALLCATNRPADAGVIPDVYNFFFGPPGVGYFPAAAYYPPVYAGYGYGAGYSVGYSAGFGGCCPAPVQTFYAPACPPCDPCRVVCDPCAVCPGGDCPVNLGSPPRPQNGDWGPTPDNDGPPRTYRDDPRNSGGSNGSEGRQPPDDDGYEEPAAGGALRPVPQRRPAPLPEPDADAAEPPAESGEGRENGESPPAEESELSLPPLDVDEKVTWRARPLRKRLTIRSRFPTPSIARTRVSPNQDWVPVAGETKLVRK